MGDDNCIFHNEAYDKKNLRLRKFTENERVIEKVRNARYGYCFDSYNNYTRILSLEKNLFVIKSRNLSKVTNETKVLGG